MGFLFSGKCRHLLFLFVDKRGIPLGWPKDAGKRFQIQNILESIAKTEKQNKRES